jgi:hypothetical protein
MKSDFDILPAWMQVHGFSWDEIMAELRADKTNPNATGDKKKPGCKHREQPSQLVPMESCGTLCVF